MKRYSNTTSDLKSVHFADGSTQFLMRGQSFESEKDVKSVDDGIRVVEVATRVKKTEQKEQD